jgi:hypothetical protein
MNISPSHLVPFLVCLQTTAKSYTSRYICPLEKVSKVAVGCKAIDQGLYILKPLRHSRHKALEAQGTTFDVAHVYPQH